MKIDKYLEDIHCTAEGKVYLDDFQARLRVNSEGCKVVTLTTMALDKHDVPVDRLVAIQYLPIEGCCTITQNCTRYEVHHINGDKTNNYLLNLRWHVA
jgi:hypothetical protein